MTDLSSLYGGKANVTRRFHTPGRSRVYDVNDMIEVRNSLEPQQSCMPKNDVDESIGLETYYKPVPRHQPSPLLLFNALLEQKNQTIYILLFIISFQSVLLWRNTRGR